MRANRRRRPLPGAVYRLSPGGRRVRRRRRRPHERLRNRATGDARADGRRGEGSLAERAEELLGSRRRRRRGSRGGLRGGGERLRDSGTHRGRIPQRTEWHAETDEKEAHAYVSVCCGGGKNSYAHNPRTGGMAARAVVDSALAPRMAASFRRVTSDSRSAARRLHR